jgi:dihydroxyacetone kinase
MNAFKSTFSRIDLAALIAACALLTACAHAPTADVGTRAAMPMSVSAAMGPIYFGDTMSFGEEVRDERAPVVATIQLEY